MRFLTVLRRCNMYCSAAVLVLLYFACPASRQEVRRPRA